MFFALFNRDRITTTLCMLSAESFGGKGRGRLEMGYQLGVIYNWLSRFINRSASSFRGRMFFRSAHAVVTGVDLYRVTCLSGCGAQCHLLGLASSRAG